MRRFFKTKSFDRWRDRAGLSDRALHAAALEMTQGLIDADLGGGIVKKRVALPGRGKSGSTRTLVATNRGSRWVFVFGFEKNERDNIDADELAALKRLATDLLKLTESQIESALSAGALKEIYEVDHGHDKT